MLRIAKKKPLRIHVGRSHLLVGFMVLFLCSCAYIWNDINSFHNSLKEQLKATSSVLSYSLVPSLDFKDDQDARKVLMSLASNSEITNALVYDNNDKIFATYGEVELKTNDLVQNIKNDGVMFENKYYFQNSILSNGQTIGRLVLVSKLTKLEEQYKNYFFIVLLVTAMGMILTLIVSNKVKTTLSSPIEGLLKLVKKISITGEYSTKDNEISEIESDILEIENLSAEFANMMGQIHHRDQTIIQSNLELESRVELRTAELMQVQNELNQSARLSALGEMASGIAHEINNPLAIILGKISIFKSKMDQGTLTNDEILVHINKIEQMTSRISKIIRGLKSFSRDGSQDPFEVASLRSIFEDATELCGAKFKGAAVDLKIPDFNQLSIDCRATQIGQVVLNLLNNAFDAIQELPEKWVKVEYELKNERLILKVIDSGPGIPAEIREKMMNPFFTTKGVGKGTGLGLSISIGIIEKHGGKLYVNAECPNTCFVIDMPIRQKTNFDVAS